MDTSAPTRLKELSLAIAYQGEQRLDPQQMQYVHALAESQSGFDELGEHLPGTPGWAKPALEQFFASQCALYRSEEDRYFQFEAYRRLFAQVLNWRSYLLGADGQGVEHSNVQDEAIRMALLLNYAAADRHGRVPVASLENAQRLLVQLGSAWEKPSAPSTWPARPIGTELQRFEGFAAPPRSCASPPAAVEERPMSAYARYIRRRALATDRPAQRSPDASEARDQPPPAGRRAESACWKYRTAMRPSSWPC